MTKIILMVYYLITPQGDVSRGEVVLPEGSTLEGCHVLLDRYAYVPPYFIDGSVWIGGYCATI